MLNLKFNKAMKHLIKQLIGILTIGILCFPVSSAYSTVGATAWDLINLIQTWRAQAGNSALVEDPLLNVTAYDTAYSMAVQGLHTHIGNAASRISAYGYGGSGTVHCTENFALSYGEADIAEIYGYWDDPDHRLPATYAYYEHVGAGVASYDGVYYYVLHACYTSDSSYLPSGSGTTVTTGDGTVVTATSAVSQIVVPVDIATPQADGSVIHIVQSGQSLWAIATAYGTKIDTIKDLNGFTTDTINNGQELLIYPAGSMPTPIPTATTTPTAAPTLTPTITATAVDPGTSTPQPSGVQTRGNSIPARTIAGYAIVLVSVVGLLGMLVKLSIKKIK